MRFAVVQFLLLLLACGASISVDGAVRPTVKPEQLVRDRGDGVERIPLLPPRPDNPRNSEGSFIALRDGRLFT